MVFKVWRSKVQCENDSRRCLKTKGYLSWGNWKRSHSNRSECVGRLALRLGSLMYSRNERSRDKSVDAHRR